MCSCTTFNKQFPRGEGALVLLRRNGRNLFVSPTSLLRLGSLNLLDTANLVSSPVAPSFISNPVFIQGGGVRLSTCIVAKVFQRDISFIRGGRVKLGPPPPVCTYTESKVSLTAAYCFDSSLNKGTIRVKNEAGMLNSSSESLPRKSSPPAFVSPLSRLHGSVKRTTEKIEEYNDRAWTGWENVRNRKCNTCFARSSCPFEKESIIIWNCNIEFVEFIRVNCC